MSVVIEILNPVWSRVTTGKNLIKPALMIKREWWVQGQYRKERREGEQCMMWGDKLLTGHLPKIEGFCEFRQLSLTTTGREELTRTPGPKPHLPGVSFRPDQLSLIEQAYLHRRGIIKAPTGTGKTILAMGVLSCFPDARTLILCHNISLVEQMADELRKHGFDSVAVLKGGAMLDLRARVLVSTMQSFVKVVNEKIADHWDVVIVDEAHHVSSFKGTYADILMKLKTPVRLGFTATMPDGPEALMAMEGLLGPIIGELGIGEAQELGLLAHPKIRIVRVPFNARIRDLRAYRNIIDEGIIHNRARNRLIAKIAAEYADEGKTSLIIVTQIDHGQNIQEMSQNIYDMDMMFVRGSTESEVRDEIKQGLKDKSVMSAICVAGGIGVWREGINIPSLDVIIGAFLGKSELALLQILGRGLRKTEEKEEMVFVDFFDPSHPKLIEHFGERMCVYSDNGWL